MFSSIHRERKRPIVTHWRLSTTQSFLMDVCLLLSKKGEVIRRRERER